MTTTTFDMGAPERTVRSLMRLAITVLFAIALFAAAFAVGRVSAPTRTVRSVVTVPAPQSVSALDDCRAGRAC